MTNLFEERLHVIQRRTSEWALYIAPRIDTLPALIQRHDDPFLPYARAIFAATHDQLCAYVFDFAAYLALGAAGMVALERSIDLVGDDHVTILDGRFSTSGYATVWEETAFGVDALTVTPDAPLAAYQSREDRQVFVVSDTPVGNPRLSPQYGRFTLNSASIRLLPLDTLYRARSLEFEATLRALVAETTRG